MRFAKVDTADGRYPTLRAESERMVWAAPYLPVPEVVACERVGSSTVLLTEALPGRDATHPGWRTDLPALVAALGRGLRAFHEAVAEEWCPFRFDIDARPGPCATAASARASSTRRTCTRSTPT